MESCNNNIHTPAWVGTQDKKVHVRILGRQTRSKIKQQSSLKLTVTENPPTQSISVFGCKWGQRTQNVLELDQTAGI